MTRLPLVAIVVIGCVLLAPMVLMDFYMDDYLHQLVLRGDQPEAPMKPWALFDFGTIADWRALDGKVGTFPWWTDAAWHVRFLRPIASVALWGQYELFGDRALGYHLTSLALFAVLLVLVHRLFRSLGMSDATARLGTLLVACSDAGVLPVGWPANQSALLVAVFAVFSFRKLYQAQDVAQIGIGLTAAVLAALTRESGSVALILAVLLLAARAREARNRRLFVGATIVSIALLAAYVLVLLVNGYGAASLFYAAPWSDPLRFAQNLALLATAGTVSLAGPFPLDVVTLFPEARFALMIVGGAIAVPLVLWVARTTSHVNGWLVAWLVLFLGVQAGAPPSDRLLFLPAIGAAGILASFFEARRKCLEGRDVRRLPRLATTVLFLAATVGSGLNVLIQGIGLNMGAEHLREKALLTDVGPVGLGHRDLFVLQTESQMQGFSLHSTWGYEHEDHALTFQFLQLGNRPLRWERTGDRTFEITTLGEPFLTRTFERVYMSAEPDFAPGDRWKAKDFDVQAVEVEDGRPTRLAFHLKKSLDDPTVRFLRAVDGRLTHVGPPAIGESIELEAPQLSGPFMP